MDRNVIILVTLALISTGCASNTGGQGIQVTDFTVQPSQVFSGQTASARLEAVNAGNLEGEITVGENGEEVLVNNCPDMFNIEEFEASSSRNSSTQESYNIGTGELIRMNWQLQQKEDRTVPRSGFTCNMRFELPFDYSVTGYKQIQVKQNRETEGSPQLQTDISGGPLTFDVELVETSTSQKDTLLKGDDASILITAYNQGNSESSYLGLIEIEDIKVTGSGEIEVEDGCGSSGTVALSSGNEEIYRCSIEYDDFESSSIRGEIQYTADYTFVKDVGTRTVEVKRSGS